MAPEQRSTVSCTIAETSTEVILYTYWSQKHSRDNVFL